MVEIILLVVLMAALLGWITLGVEDNRYWNKVEANPPRILIRVNAEFWEDSLPHRQPLPWIETATA